MGWDRLIRVRDLIPGILKEWKEQCNSPLQSVRSVWVSVVGEAVAVHAAPVALEDAILTVSVDSPLWQMELARFQSARVVKEVNQFVGFPIVRHLRLILRSGSGRNPRVQQHGES